MRRPMSRPRRHAGVGVVPGEPLPDVVQERAPRGGGRDARTLAARGAAWAGGLEEVSVDGEAVVGVALGPVAHRSPLGQESDEQPPLVEGLERRDGGGTRWRAPARARSRIAVGPRVGRGARRPSARGRGRSGRWAVGARRPPPPPAAPGAGRRRGRSRARGRPRPSPACPATWRDGDAGLDRGSSVTASRSSVEAPGPRPDRHRRRGWETGQLERRRQTSSVTQATVRPASAIDAIRASASSKPSAAATWSCSWRSSRSVARPVLRCSSTRAAVSVARGTDSESRSTCSRDGGDGQGRRRARRGSRAVHRVPLSGRARAGMRRHRGRGDARRLGRRAPGATAPARARHWSQCLGQAWARPPRRRRPRPGRRADPSWARRSSFATSSTSGGRRTEWSSRMPSSQTGYQTASATFLMSRRPRGRGRRRDRCRGTARHARSPRRRRGRRPRGSPPSPGSRRPANHWSAAAENAVQKASPWSSVLAIAAPGARNGETRPTVALWTCCSGTRGRSRPRRGNPTGVAWWVAIPWSRSRRRVR